MSPVTEQMASLKYKCHSQLSAAFIYRRGGGGGSTFEAIQRVLVNRDFESEFVLAFLTDRQRQILVLDLFLKSSVNFNAHGLPQAYVIRKHIFLQVRT